MLLIQYTQARLFTYLWMSRKCPQNKKNSVNPACPVAPEDGTGVDPEDRIGACPVGGNIVLGPAP